MKKLAKLTSLLLAGIMALAMLTACNGTPSAAEAEALGKQYTAQALAILNEYRATQNTEQTPYPQLDNDPELLALAEQQLMRIGQDGKILGSDTLYIPPEEEKKNLNVWVMIEPFKPGEKGDVTERYPALALTKQRLEELNTTKVFGGNLPLASQKTLDDITRVAFAYRVVGGKAYVAMAFAHPIEQKRP